MRKSFSILTASLMTMTMASQPTIPAIDIHSHIVTGPYLQYLADKNALMEDGIVRLSRIRVNPQYLDEYMKYAAEVGAISLATEPGVLTMYAVADKKNPCEITILETYASHEAYRSHIASEHFQKYKQGTLHMVESLQLDDVTPLNPANVITNTIEARQ